MGSDKDGGAETYFVDLVRALSEDGVEQGAVIRPHAAREAALAEGHVPAVEAPFGGPLDLTTRPRIARTARTLKASLLLQWMNRAGRFAPKGPWKRVGRLGGYYDLKYYKGCDMLVANTPNIVDYIVGAGWPARRVRYIANFAQAGPEPAISRAQFDTPEGVPLLLAMGRLHKVKAHDVALRALAQLPGAWLWIAGAGLLEGRLKRLAIELCVADRVRFLGWRSDAAALYRAADVCVFPSRFEPLGNVVIQAWAHGLPLVAAASAGPAALVRDGEDGLLTPVDDHAALAAAVRRLLDDASLRRRLREAGLDRVARDFSKPAVVAQWRTLFAELGAA